MFSRFLHSVDERFLRLSARFCGFECSYQAVRHSRSSNAGELRFATTGLTLSKKLFPFLYPLVEVAKGVNVRC